jgi:hypothetical protein
MANDARTELVFLDAAMAQLDVAWPARTLLLDATAARLV